MDDWRDLLDGMLGDLTNWPPDDEDITTAVHALIERLVGGDYSELAIGVFEALRDGDISKSEIIQLAIAVIDTLPDNELTNGLRDALEDGELELIEVGQVAAAWIASNSPNAAVREAIKELIVSIKNDSLSTDAIKTALIEFVRRSNADIGAALEQALNTQLPLRSTLLTLVPLLIKQGWIDNIGSTTEEKAANLLAVFNNEANNIPESWNDLVTRLTNFDSDNIHELLKTVLGLLGSDSEAIIGAVLQGNIGKIITDRLTTELTQRISDLIDGIDEQDSQALATTIISIIKGEKELVPTQSEQDELNMNDKGYDMFKRTRKVVYATILAVEGGAIVPTVAMAKPHVFAAAAIRSDTTLNELVEEDERAKFLELLPRFAKKEFQDHPNIVNLTRNELLSLRELSELSLELFDLFLRVNFRLSRGA